MHGLSKTLFRLLSKVLACVWISLIASSGQAQQVGCSNPPGCTCSPRCSACELFGGTCVGAVQEPSSTRVVRTPCAARE